MLYLHLEFTDRLMSYTFEPGVFEPGEELAAMKCIGSIFDSHPTLYAMARKLDPSMPMPPPWFPTTGNGGLTPQTPAKPEGMKE